MHWCGSVLGRADSLAYLVRYPPTSHDISTFVITQKEQDNTASSLDEKDRALSLLCTGNDRINDSTDPQPDQRKLPNGIPLCYDSGHGVQTLDRKIWSSAPSGRIRQTHQTTEIRKNPAGSTWHMSSGPFNKHTWQRLMISLLDFHPDGSLTGIVRIQRKCQHSARVFTF